MAKKINNGGRMQNYDEKDGKYVSASGQANKTAPQPKATNKENKGVSFRGLFDDDVLNRLKLTNEGKDIIIKAPTMKPDELKGALTNYFNKQQPQQPQTQTAKPVAPQPQANNDLKVKMAEAEQIMAQNGVKINNEAIAIGLKLAYAMGLITKEQLLIK